jgi:hypothetical protein
MRILEQRRKRHLSMSEFLELVDMLILKKEFLAEDVRIIYQLLQGTALYDMRIKGEMIPNSERPVRQVSREQLEGVAQSMSYFCDKYGVIKGFILGELYFRRDLSAEGLRRYAEVLSKMDGRNTQVRSRFFYWLAGRQYARNSASDSEL